MKFTIFKKPIDALCVVIVGYSIPWKHLRIKRDIVEVVSGCKSGASKPYQVKHVNFYK